MLVETAAEVIYNSNLDAVEIIWIDFANTEQYKRIMEFALKLINDNNCTCWISDMTNGKAVTKESFFWLKTNYIPRASKTKLKKCGFLVTGNVFRKLYAESLKGVINHYGGEMKYFNDRESLDKWIIQ